jgi:hypothetical protein
MFRNISVNFSDFLQHVAELSLKLVIFRRCFHQILSEWREIPDNCRRPVYISSGLQKKEEEV